MTRIAQVAYHTSPLAALGGRSSGGLNVYVLELSRELAALGYEVDMFTRNDFKSVMVARMEVPCCSGLTRLVKAAIENSGKIVPFAEVPDHNQRVSVGIVWVGARAAHLSEVTS